MIPYRIISTGSQGNAVIVNDFMLIDCGVPYKSLAKYVPRLKLVLLTHIHSDHFRPSTLRRLSLERPLLRFGCCRWLVSALVKAGVPTSNIDVLEPDVMYGYGVCNVIPVSLVHNVPNCGYKIHFPAGKVFYATDTNNLNGIVARHYDLYMIEANYEDAEIQKLDYVGLVFQSDAPLFSDYPQFSQQFNLEKSQQDFDTYQFDGETYIAISTPLDSGDLSLVALLRTTSILMEVTAFQYVIVFVTALLMMTAPFFLVLINRRIIAPARQICSVMQDFGQGNLSIRFQQPHVYEEFQLIGSTFNHMATEIGQLKIAAYEKQLDAQRTEMQFLQLQLTPHFYINSLNVIYSLAQTADFPTIQKMVLALTKYFRYSLQSHSALVPLRDEIQHVESYVAIQKMRYSDRLTVHCQVPQELMGRDVPLFLLQTFVENSMKYAFTGESAVRVEVQAALGDNEELIVSIRDNGPGYPASILDGSLLNDTANSHIGIENVRKRLALLYQEKASLVLSNPPDGGAQATIVIPSE